MHPTRIRSQRSLGSRLLSLANRCTRPLGIEIARHPAPTTLDWHIKTLLDYMNINCVLDVGANRGQYAERLRRLGYRGWIISFEPIPDVYDELRSRFHDDHRWRGFSFALGELDEVRPFHVAHGDAQASSFLEFRSSGETRWGHDHTVREILPLRVHRLDAIWDECLEAIDSPRVFLKMDCQGFDLKVMAGASAKVPEILAVQSELALEQFYDHMTHFSAAVETYEKLGFDAVGFFPVARRTPDYLRLVEMDCLFLRNLETIHPSVPDSARR